MLYSWRAERLGRFLGSHKNRPMDMNVMSMDMTCACQALVPLVMRSSGLCLVSSNALYLLAGGAKNIHLVIFGTLKHFSPILFSGNWNVGEGVGDCKMTSSY